MGANNILRPDKSKMLDTVAHYVERIVQSGNELIDIVVPYQPATEDDKEPLKDKLTELLCDIWDNFVYMTGDTRRIVLLAAGFGCYSMISFMNERQKDVARYVSCAVVVPGGDEAVPMVTKRLANWYMDHSFVVVADDHPIWERVNQKMSNRTGNIVRSGKSSLVLVSCLILPCVPKLIKETKCDVLTKMPFMNSYIAQVDHRRDYQNRFHGCITHCLSKSTDGLKLFLH